mmetsp:Transcript_34175/g.50215  ORF Transcript_34175/g.50215 Transcript_34175/m.50215 type:complete len:116 (+) Transcript_34175:2020-2367(+)
MKIYKKMRTHAVAISHTLMTGNTWRKTFTGLIESHARNKITVKTASCDLVASSSDIIRLYAMADNPSKCDQARQCCIFSVYLLPYAVSPTYAGYFCYIYLLCGTDYFQYQTKKDF